MSGDQGPNLSDIMLEQYVLHRRLDRLEARLARDTVSLDRLRLVALTLCLLGLGMVIGALLSDLR